MSEQQQVRQVKELHKEAILEKPNVVGVGVGYKVVGGQKTAQVCIVVLVRQKLPPAALSPEALVPSEVDGVVTDVVQVGDIRALQARTDRWRPAPGGVSVGHYQVTAGTLGCVVRDKVSRERLILSNNHVLANSNDASPGDPVFDQVSGQPEFEKPSAEDYQLLIYYWRGAHDYLYFTSADKTIVGSGWWHAYE